MGGKWAKGAVMVSWSWHRGLEVQPCGWGALLSSRRCRRSAHGLLVHPVDVHGFCKPEGMLDWQGRTGLGLGQCWEQVGAGLGLARKESRPALGCMDLGRTSLEAVQLVLARFRSCNWALEVARWWACKMGSNELGPWASKKIIERNKYELNDMMLI